VTASADEMVRINGGEFAMGSEHTTPTRDPSVVSLWTPVLDRLDNRDHRELGRPAPSGGIPPVTIQYCFRYRPGARRLQMIDAGMSHPGFR
jgi:formylglycine-generating enzyme required for sulfatase activity